MAKKTPQINSGSMADISFLLISFFLLTSSINTDMGISRKLPPPPDPLVEPPEVKQRNIFTVLVNQYDRLMVEGKPGDIATLREQAKEFMSNPANDPELPEKTVKFIPNLGEVFISKNAIISLKNDRGTSYEMYLKVQNELTAAINELRDELSIEKFGVKMNLLTDEAKIDAIKKAIPVAISESEPENIGGQ